MKFFPRMERQDDALLLGIGAFALGYLIAQGKGRWLAQSGFRVAERMATLTLNIAMASFREKNADFFSEKFRAQPLH